MDGSLRLSRGVEHALVFASIIVGVAITDQMISLNRLLRARHRVRWDWAVPAVALLALLTVVQIWWSVAQPGVRQITIGQFLPILLELILLFLLCAATLPDEIPAEGLSLRDYYDAQGPYVWTLFAAALAWTFVAGQIALAANGQWGLRELLDRGVDLVVLALMVSLVFVRRRWWHAIVLLALATGPIGWLSRSLA